jgi:hypothetical protein
MSAANAGVPSSAAIAATPNATNFTIVPYSTQLNSTLKSTLPQLSRVFDSSTLALFDLLRPWRNPQEILPGHLIKIQWGKPPAIAKQLRGISTNKRRKQGSRKQDKWIEFYRSRLLSSKQNWLKVFNIRLRPEVER